MTKFDFLSYKEALLFSKKMVNEFFTVKLKQNNNIFEVEVATRDKSEKRKKLTSDKNSNMSEKIKAAPPKIRLSIIKVNGKFEYVKTKNIPTSESKVLRYKHNAVTQRTLDALKIADKVLAKDHKEKKKNTSMYFNKIKRK